MITVRRVLDWTPVIHYHDPKLMTKDATTSRGRGGIARVELGLSGLGGDATGAAKQGARG